MCNGTTSLLEYIGTFDIPEMTEPFVVNEHIQNGMTVGGVKWWLGSNFLQHFSGTVLPPCSVKKANIRKLAKESVVGTPIIAELGGETVAEIGLAQLHWMIVQQPKGEHGQGNLLTNGFANILYIRDINGVLWVVGCLWSSDDHCWIVEANSVSSLCMGEVGDQVISG